MPFTLRNVGGSKFGEGKAEGDEGKICGVWGSAGKIYICTNENKHLFVTDSAPRSRWAEKYDTIIDSATESILAVFQNPRCPGYQIYVVYNNSITDCLEHSPSTNQWIKKYSFQLSNAKGAEILTICFHQHTSMFFWCEKRGSILGLASCCVCMREVPEDWDENFMVGIGPVVAILQCCPMMSLFIINKGVCIVPQLPDEEKQLLFYWTFVPRSLKIYIWDSETVNSLGKTDFRSIMMHLLPLWNSAVKTDHIICLTCHPTTLELLILDGKYTLSYAFIQDGELCIQQLSKLNLQFDHQKETISSMFAFGLFTGLVFESGVLNIFDSRSGIGLCTIQELAGQSLLVWTYVGSMPSIGVWTANGIWEIKSKPISEVAGVMQNSCHLNNQNNQGNNKCKNHGNLAQEENVSSKIIILCDKCFPGFIHCAVDPTNLSCTCENRIPGPLASTQYLQEWNMHTEAAQVALSTVALKMTFGNTDNFPEVEKELLEILLGEMFQSPVASLILFYQHPCYKGQVLSSVKSSLQNWDKKMEGDKLSTKTTLNDLLYDYIKQFIALTDKCDNMATTQNMFCDFKSDLGSNKDEVEHLFNKLNLVNPDSNLLSRLTYLQGQSQNEVCGSVAQTMGLKRFSEENTSPQELKINNQRWRKLFRIEWKDGHWHKSRAALEGSVSPSLGFLCNLLYNEEPDWLLTVYENGKGLVHAKDTDERAKDYVTQSMLDCLPSLIVDPSPKSTYVHAILLWMSGQELQAMQVILRHQMWSQALDFFSSFAEHSNFCFALFAMMLKAFVQYNAPKVMLFKALSLVPPGFSAYELLFLLQQNGPRFDEPFQDDKQILTVGDIREQLQNMLTH